MSYLGSQQISPYVEGNLIETFQFSFPLPFATSGYANAHMYMVEHKLWLTV